MRTPPYESSNDDSYFGWATIYPTSSSASSTSSTLRKQSDSQIKDPLMQKQEFDSLRHLDAAHLRNHDTSPSSNTVVALDEESCGRGLLCGKESYRAWSLCGGDIPHPTPLLISKEARSLRQSQWIAAPFTPLSWSTDALDSITATETPKTAFELPDCFANHIASTKQLDNLTASHPLPAVAGAKWKRDARHVYWSLYRKLWALVVLVNVVILGLIITKPTLVGGFTYHQASTATGANFLIAALGRQEHVINLLFRAAGLLPWWTPLCIRRQAAHLYTYGGLHSGCGISAFLWYIYFTILLVRQFEGTNAEAAALGPTTAMILAVLLLVLIMSLPSIRARWHNQWELSHRYGGWSAIILSWAQTFITCIAQAGRNKKPIAYELTRAPTFWILLLISCCLLYPWIRLRRRKVETEVLSDHAVRLWFKGRRRPTCVSCHLSHAPLMENHGFAIIPNSDEKRGYSIVVSNAGDWTKALIENPPTRIWTRGAPTTGPLRIATLFSSIVVVATASGIGPCLSFLQVYPDYHMRILWAARSPERTYGVEIMNAVLRADRRAVIVDEDKIVQPDLVALAYALYHEISAEAIVVVSNAKFTAQMVYEMEVRGIAAFGPIF